MKNKLWTLKPNRKCHAKDDNAVILFQVLHCGVLEKILYYSFLEHKSRSWVQICFNFLLSLEWSECNNDQNVSSFASVHLVSEIHIEQNTIYIFVTLDRCILYNNTEASSNKIWCWRHISKKVVNSYIWNVFPNLDVFIFSHN